MAYWLSNDLKIIDLGWSTLYDL